MAVFVFNSPNELYDHIIAEIGPTGTENITGQKHRDILQTLMLSLINIMASLPGQTVNDFPAWSGATTYTGGSEVVVRHDNKLWLFLSGTDVLGTEPGTNGLVWQEISAVQLAHFRNKDQYLDNGGPAQVSAQELRTHLDGAQFWREPADGLEQAPSGAEADGTILLVDSSATGDFAGHDGEVATKVSGVWAFSAAQNMEARTIKASTDLALNLAGQWVLLDFAPGLEEVLTKSNVTGNNHIQLQKGFHYLPQGITHAVAGNLTLDLGGRCAFNVQLMANATILLTNLPLNVISHFRLRILSLGSYTLTWPVSGLLKPNGVTLPTALTVGEIWEFEIEHLHGSATAILAATKLVAV